MAYSISNKSEYWNIVPLCFTCHRVKGPQVGQNNLGVDLIERAEWIQGLWEEYCQTR